MTKKDLVDRLQKCSKLIGEDILKLERAQRELRSLTNIINDMDDDTLFEIGDEEPSDIEIVNVSDAASHMEAMNLLASQLFEAGRRHYEKENGND